MKKLNFAILTLFSVVACFLVFHQAETVNALRQQISELKEARVAQKGRDKYAQQRELERDVRLMMFAVCRVAEFAVMEGVPSPEQKLTISQAEFELYYFTRKYLTFMDDSMVELLHSDVREWAISGEYYSAMESLPVALEAVKYSTNPYISPDGEVYYLLERIHDWLNKS